MRIAIFSADPVIGEALACLIVHTAGMKVVACMSNLSSAPMVIEAQRPDLLLVTEDFSDEASRFALQKLKSASGVKTMLLHARDSVDSRLFEEFDHIQSRWPGVGALCDALRQLSGAAQPTYPTGASEGEAKDTLEPIDSLRTLTVRERETAELVVQGMSNLQIGAVLGLSEPTIKLYVSKLLRIFDCENRVQLALKLARRGGPRPIRSASQK